MIDANDQNYKFYLAKHINFSYKGNFPCGWNNYVDSLRSLSGELKILDIGCGDLRFLEFLNRNELKFSSYTGVDQINYNKSISSSNIKIIVEDILDYIIKEKDQYNYITIFNTLYHFNSKIVLEKIIPELASRICAGGYLAFSLWDFKQVKSLEERLELVSEQEKKYKIFTNDEVYRIAYDQTSSEFLDSLNKVLINKNFLKKLEIKTTGLNDTSNTYFLYKNI